MKIVAKSLLLGLLILASFCGIIALTASAAHARPADDHLVKTAARHVMYVSPSGNVVHLNIAKPAGQPLSVRMVNQYGDVLVRNYFPKRREGTIKLKFDVTELKDGQYQVQLLSDDVRNTYSFTLTTPEAKQVSRLISVL